MADSEMPRRQRVAIVDDEKDVVTYLAFALRDNGYETLTCTTPGEALTAMQEFRPDLVLLDLLMPEQMGISLYRDFLRDSALGAVPVVILSGIASEDEMATLVETQLGGDRQPAGYLEKPVDIQRLLRTVAHLVGGSQGANP